MTQLTESIASQVIELLDALGIKPFDFVEDFLPDWAREADLYFPGEICTETAFEYHISRAYKPIEVEGVEIPMIDVIRSFKSDDDAVSTYTLLLERYEARMAMSSEWTGIVWGTSNIYYYETAAVVQWIQKAEAAVRLRHEQEAI